MTKDQDQTTEKMTLESPNRVNVHLGFTKNLGNFESVKIDVGLASDKNPDESTAEAFRRVKDFVKGALMEAVEEVVSEIG